MSMIWINKMPIECFKIKVGVQRPIINVEVKIVFQKILAQSEMTYKSPSQV